jgi:CO dehydrogenase/acetyl-CoA synthase beta subunit
VPVVSLWKYLFAKDYLRENYEAIIEEALAEEDEDEDEDEDEEEKDEEEKDEEDEKISRCLLLGIKRGESAIGK